MSETLELNRARDGEFDFHLKSANGQIVSASQLCQAKRSAANGVVSVRKNATAAGYDERKVTKSGRHDFVPRAANHLVIGTSQMDAAAAAMATGIDSVKKNAPKAALVDRT